MRKTIIKFGGSNLQKAKDYLTLCNLVKTYVEPPVIVISAFSGITDKLLKTWNAEKDINISERLLNDIGNLHKNILFQNINNTQTLNKCLIELNVLLDKMREVFSCRKSADDYDTKDVFLSYGERLSSWLFVKILTTQNIPAQWALPEEMGLYTNGIIGNATIDFLKSKKKINDFFTSDHCYVIPGFYGISANGKVTTFGRSGSDYTAAALANILNASSLDLWKDVDGVLSCDPNLVINPVSIHCMSYAEASELAYFGAKILHPLCIEPVEEKNIPVRIFNINSQHIKPVTLICSEKNINKQIVKSVTYSKQFSLVKLEGAGLGYKHGVLSKVTSLLFLNNINIKSVITSQTSITLLLSEEDAKEAVQKIFNKKIDTIKTIKTVNNVATIALVGEGLTEQYGIAGKVFGALAKAEINVKLISFGSSDVAIYFIIDTKDCEAAVSLIHEEFFAIINSINCN